jgi:hypothetical protein
MSGKSKRLIDADGRECSRCGKYKAWHEFSPGGGPHGKESRCKGCQTDRVADYLATREGAKVKRRRVERQSEYQRTDAGRAAAKRARLKYRYGITEEQYLWMYEQQDGVCILCGFPESVPHPASGTLKNLGVEHSHSCVMGHDPERACKHCIRGLACYNCNIYMARVERSPRLLGRFADYLVRRPLLHTDI